MLEVIGQMLPAALGVALSPFPIIAVVVLLASPRATTAGPSFVAGWLLGLGALTAVVVALTDGAQSASGQTSTVVGWVKVAVGIALLALAVRKWITRPRPGDPEKAPAWMASLDGAEAPRAFLIGLLLGGANPKNIAFTVAAGSSIAVSTLEGSEDLIAAALYVVLASSTVLAALGARLLAGDRAAAPLETVRRFMVANGAVITMVVLAVLGAMVLGEGLAEL